NGVTWRPQENVPANHPSDTVSLQPSHHYLFRVVAGNSAGDSAPSNVVTVDTPADPRIPRNLRVLSVSSNSADLAWDEVSGEDHYRVEVSTNAGASWSLQENVPADHGYHDTVTLQPGRTYWFHVVAVYGNGESAGSNVVRVDTPSGPVSPPP